jgi:UrcA family protein
MCAAIALSSATFGSAAFAQSPSQSTESVSKTVAYNDLDLSTKEGQKRFETRVKSAVKQVCGQANSRDLNDVVLMQQCRFKATNEAKRDMQVAIASYNNGRIASK